MSAVTTQGSTTVVRGVVLDKATQRPVIDVIVTAYDKDLLTKTTSWASPPRTPRGGLRSASTRAPRATASWAAAPTSISPCSTAARCWRTPATTPSTTPTTSTPDIVLMADLSNDKMRGLLNPTPAPGWVGGFAQSNPAFAYPTPDLSSLPILGNRENIPLLVRQQKVVWPEFSWNSVPDGQDKKRCYQMFAPDISRLGYTAEGRVYSIICPQQAAVAPQLGAMNVEVTVTGNRGWADESNRTLAADMSVQGRIWFSPSAHERPMVKRLLGHFGASGLPFPSDKKNAIIVKTSRARRTPTSRSSRSSRGRPTVSPSPPSPNTRIWPSLWVISTSRSARFSPRASPRWTTSTRPCSTSSTSPQATCSSRATS
jgi:hypothetical protein